MDLRSLRSLGYPQNWTHECCLREPVLCPLPCCGKAFRVVIEMCSDVVSHRWNSCILFHTIGTSIRRQRISLPPPDEDQFYTVHHFNINIDIIFYGRTFKIYDCDTFTKNFLKKIGVKLNPPGQCPEDPYMKIRREVRSYIHEFLCSEWESIKEGQ